MELMKEFKFEASHILPKHPGKCSRLHGHSWVLKVYVKGEINPDTGFVMDYVAIKNVVQPIIDVLDHHHLGVFQFLDDENPSLCCEMPKRWRAPIEGKFYPTSENLIMWIAPQLYSLDLYRVKRRNLPIQIQNFKPGEIIPFEERERIDIVTQWSRIELNETCTSAAILTREEYNAIQR